MAKERKEATPGQDEIIRIHTHTGHQQRSNEVQIIIMINALGAVVWHNTLPETSNEGGSLICEYTDDMFTAHSWFVCFLLYSRGMVES